MHPVYLTRAARRELIIISDAVYTRYGAIQVTRQIPRSKLPRPIYDILTQSSNVL